ncbi:MAG: hypothetical protein ACR2PR_12000 [Pseudohongiellaceae bacterium]
MIKKLLNIFKKKVTPAVDTSISGRGNNHTISHWHDDTYMDSQGYTYKVKRITFNNKRQARFKEMK